MVQKNTVLLDDKVAVTQWDLHLDVLLVRTYIRTNSDELYSRVRFLLASRGIQNLKDNGCV